MTFWQTITRDIARAGGFTAYVGYTPGDLRPVQLELACAVFQELMHPHFLFSRCSSLTDSFCT